MDNFLKNIRLTLGYNQQEIADKLNLNINTYRSYEYQKRDLSNELILKLVDIFNINVHYLYTGQGDMFISTCLNTCNKQDNNKIVKNLDSFYKRFNQLQKENDLNDYQFSKETGIPEARIEKLGIGKVLPTLEELNALKTHFDVSIDWLLYGETPCRIAQSENNTLSAQEITILKQVAQKFNV